MKIILRFVIVFLFLTNWYLPLQAKIPLPKRFYGGLSIGVGLPKIPLSHFRAPVSVLGTGMMHYRLDQKIRLQLEGGGLTTFNLGTASREAGTLTFNFLWSSFDVQWRIMGHIRRESFLSAGPGYYQLNQEFDNDKVNLNTFGVNLGLISWTWKNKWISLFDLRWHLLFKPKNNPQVLTISFGIVF
jgi:hypothetical protein